MMGHHSHRQTARRIHRLFTSGLPPDRATRWLTEAASCDCCRDELRVYYRFEGALYGSPPGASAAAIDRIASAVTEADTTSTTSAIPRSVRILVPAAAIGVAAVAMLWALIPLSSHRIPADRLDSTHAVELVSRGGGHPGSPDVGIRAFSISKTAGAVAEKGTLSLVDVMTFTYTRAVPGPGYLALFGLQSGEDVIWYYPDFGDPSGISISGDQVDMPLGDGFDLTVHHHEGPLVVVGIFSDTPLSTAAIERIADGLLEGRSDMTFLAAYPWTQLGSTVLAHTLVLTVEANHD